MSFFKHALNLFSHKSVVAELSVMESLMASDWPDKKELAEKCFSLIDQEFQNITHEL